MVKQTHPRWTADAVKAIVQATTQPLACPPDWEPLGEADERERCYGVDGRTSFFGHGLVDGEVAAVRTPAPNGKGPWSARHRRPCRSIPDPAVLAPR